MICRTRDLSRSFSENTVISEKCQPSYTAMSKLGTKMSQGYILMKKGCRIIKFQMIRRDSIRWCNKKKLWRKFVMFQNKSKQRKYTKLTQCNACLAFLSRRFLSLYKNMCTTINNCSVVFLPVTGQVILVRWVENYLNTLF